MRLRTTIFLFLLVALLSGFVFVWERHQRGSSHTEVGTSLVSLKSADIESMEIKNAAGTAKFKKKPTDGLWYLTEPFDDRADRDFINRVLELAEKSEIAEVVTDERLDNDARKPFGLDDGSAMQVAYRMGGKTIARIRLGKSGTTGDTVYAAAPGDSAHPYAYLMWAKNGPQSASIRDVLARPIADMRDPLLAPYSADQVTRFAVRQGAGELEISRTRLNDKEATPWVLTKPLKTRGNQGQIDHFVRTFCKARALSLLPPNSQPNGAEKPAAELTLWDDPTARGSAIRFYADPDPAAKTLLGYLPERKTWFKLEKEYLDAIPQSPNALRSSTLADLNPARVSTIIIDSPQGEHIALYKIKGQWFIKQSDSFFRAASAERVTKLIDGLNKAQIGEYTTDSLTNPAQYGLETPMVTATFASGENKSATELTTPKPENSITLRLGQAANNRLYANFAGEPSVYQLMPEHFSLIPMQSVIYRDLQVLDFTPLSVRRVRQTIGSEPPIEASAPPRSFEWSVTRAGTDVSNLLDQEQLNRIINRMASLHAADWAHGLKEGHEALEKQTLEIELDVEYQEDAASGPKIKTVTVAFAPAGGDEKGAVFYYGRCTDIEFYFFIKRDLYKELAKPMLDPARAKANP